LVSIHEEEESIALRKLYSLSDDVGEVVGEQVIGNQVSEENQPKNLLVLVNVGKF